MVRRNMLRVKCVPSPSEILAARLERMLTQEEAAGQVGVAPRTWQNWEAGAAIPRAKHQRALVAWIGETP